MNGFHGEFLGKPEKMPKDKVGAPCAESGPVIELKNAKLHHPPPRMYEKNR